MNQGNALMTVIGTGSYGTALAITLARNGHQVVLWGHNPRHVVTLEHGHCSIAFLPDVPFLNTLRLENDLATALTASHNILAVVPSHVFGKALRNIKPLIRFDAQLTWATKGLEAETGRLLQDVTREALGDLTLLAAISGPAFAKELAADMPMAISLVPTDDTFADGLQQLLHYGKSLRVYSNPDFIGAQLGGAAKNVVTISTGVPDSIGLGANARTALITHGLTEMSCPGTALGADPATFMGMVGLDDLVLTCANNQSYNRHFGTMLGQGMNMQGAQDKIGQVVEDYRNTKEARELARRFGAETPVAEEIYQVLCCGKNACEAALTLLGCACKNELSHHQL